MEILVMRHGQSVADIEQRCEGHADFALTPRGEAQAELAAPWIATHYPPEMLFSSPLKRAARTAEILADTLKLPITYDDDLREINIGIWAGLPKAEAFQRFPMPAGGFQPHQCVPQGESGIELRARAERFLSQLLWTHADVGRIVIISHGTLIMMLFQAFLDLPMGSRVGLTTGDTGLHLWKIAKDRRHILFTNKCDHLLRSPAEPS